MLLETCQILYTAHWHVDFAFGRPEGVDAYRRTHYNHPCCVWVREASLNYTWLACHGIGILEEYEKRYQKFNHKCKPHIQWLRLTNPVTKKGFTPFALAMPDQYKTSDPVESYRNYYLGDKARFAKWNKSTPPPSWWKIKE